MKQAHEALKLSWREKLGAFLPRMGIGGLVGLFTFRPIYQIVKEVLPVVTDKLHDHTMGKVIWQKGDVTVHAPTPKSVQTINEINDKVRGSISRPMRVSLLASAAISVGVGTILTIRSLQHYKKEQNFLAELYADQLMRTEEGHAVPPPPDKKDLAALHKWRSHARNSMNQATAEDTIYVATSNYL